MQGQVVWMDGLEKNADEGMGRRMAPRRGRVAAQRASGGGGGLRRRRRRRQDGGAQMTRDQG